MFVVSVAEWRRRDSDERGRTPRAGRQVGVQISKASESSSDDFRFKMPIVMDKCAEFLMTTKEVTLGKKYVIAHRYRHLGMTEVSQAQLFRRKVGGKIEAIIESPLVSLPREEVRGGTEDLRRRNLSGGALRPRRANAFQEVIPNDWNGGETKTAGCYGCLCDFFSCCSHSGCVKSDLEQLEQEILEFGIS